MAAGALARAASGEPLTVAVLPFESKDDAVHDLGPKIADLLNANLSASPLLITVERAQVDKSLGEMELGLSGTVSSETAARIGHLTGAKVLVTGRAFKVERQLVVVAKIISTETSRVYGEVEQGDPSRLTDLTTKLAAKITADVTTHADTLVAKEVPREQRIERLARDLKGDKRPAVSVRITEQHFGARVIDPAAETELGYILQKAGFKLVDSKSDQKPDIEITGDAFSAYGMRKGNLISCQSRIEVKVRQRANGSIIAVDRQSSVAVDLAEETAAKTSLQNAADALAERILPKLAGP
jgi:hypothetical protein